MRFSAPRVGALLQACNMAESITTESSPGAGDGHVDYTPHSDAVNAKSLTIYYYIDGELYKIVGAVGTFKINGQVGSFPTIDFTFKGKLLSASDSPMPSSVSFESTKPVPFQNVQFTLDGNNSFVCSQLTVDINNTISERPDIQEPDGVKGFFISDRSPNGYIDPERVLRATYDLFGKFKAGTEGSMSAVVGTTPGNIVEITAPAVQYTEELLNELLLKYAIEDEKARKMIINGSIAAYRQIITLIRDLSILGEEDKKKSESMQG